MKNFAALLVFWMVWGDVSAGIPPPAAIDTLNKFTKRIERFAPPEDGERKVKGLCACMEPGGNQGRAGFFVYKIVATSPTNDKVHLLCRLPLYENGNGRASSDCSDFVPIAK